MLCVRSEANHHLHVLFDSTTLQVADSKDSKKSFVRFLANLWHRKAVYDVLFV